ncbi:MAG: hypothetical protein Kow0098_03980 [Ignavibacteriaceae bacterium]
MSTQNRSLAVVISNKLFAEIDKSQVEANLDQKSFIDVKEGDIIFSTGEKAEFVYLIADGIVKVKISDKNQLLEKKKSDFFGETEVLKNISRISSAVAETDCLLYRIEQSKFIQMAKSLRGILKNISGQPSTEKNDSDIPFNSSKLEETTEPEKLSYPPKLEQTEEESFTPEKQDNSIEEFPESEKLTESEFISDLTDKSLIDETTENEEIPPEAEIRESDFLMPDLIKNFLKNHSTVMKYYRGYLHSGKVSGKAEHLLQLITEQSEFYSELVLSAVEYFEDKQSLKRKRYSLIPLLDELLELLSEQLAPSDITLYKKYECDGELFADRYRLLAVLHLCSQILIENVSGISGIYVSVTSSTPDIVTKLFTEAELPADAVKKIQDSHEFLLSESIVKAHNGIFNFRKEEKISAFEFTLPAENITTI